MRLRWLAVAYLVIALVAMSIGAVRSYFYIPVLWNSEPQIHDAQSLPDRIRACGRTWSRGQLDRRQSWAELVSTYGFEPLTVDPAILAACPPGACSFIATKTSCHTVVYARVGDDAYVDYSLSGGP